MRRMFALMAPLVMLVPAAAQAQVGNSVLFNVRLGTDLIDFYNNVALDSAAGLTNPLFDVVQGQTLLFGVSLTGSRPDQLVATFAGVPATFSQPNNSGVVTGNSTITYAPTLGGGANYTTRLTFDTIGSYTGTINLNALLTNPDYAFDGGVPTREAPTFTYRVNVASAVPEPATWGMMAGGFALAGGVLRRRAKPAAARA